MTVFFSSPYTGEYENWEKRCNFPIREDGERYGKVTFLLRLGVHTHLRCRQIVQAQLRRLTVLQTITPVQTGKEIRTGIGLALQILRLGVSKSYIAQTKPGSQMLFKVFPRNALPASSAPSWLGPARGSPATARDVSPCTPRPVPKRGAAEPREESERAKWSSPP